MECGYGTWGRGVVVDSAVLGLDSMILKAFSKLGDSVVPGQ